MPPDYLRESLCHDPLHGYIAFTAAQELGEGETAEQHLIDHPWVQRLRQIHQLQTAWWVFPTAEHTRFQHVLGAMHLASRAAAHLYASLAEVCPDVPSRGYLESLLRVAALLHDVGHGPFGHFFDDHYLRQFGVTHEDVGAAIITGPLAELIRGIRRSPNSALEDSERLDPEHVAYLIRRPRKRANGTARHARSTSETARSEAAGSTPPRWLDLLRALFSGLYTVDNMDFVLRDSYMAGFSARAFDLDRLLHYSFFTDDGLTIHQKGLAELVRFIGVRAELFRTIYFHRTVRALDLTLAGVFRPTLELLFPGNPLEHLDAYARLTEWSLLTDLARWPDDADAHRAELGRRWQGILRRDVPWKMACELTAHFQPGQAESASIVSEPELIERRVREQLPAKLRELDLQVDVARHYHRPGTAGPAGGQNFLYDDASERTRALEDHELFSRLPMSFSICRVYALDHQHDAALASALAHVFHGQPDAVTNM